MSPTSQWQRPAPLAVLLLLLAVVLAPLVGAAASGGGAPGGPTTARAASAVRTPEAVPVADLRVDTSSGGSCRQQDGPLGGVQAAVAVPHADPVTCPAGARGTLPQDRAPRTGGVRAPPAPPAGTTGPLPVLRI
ncbi:MULTISPECIES: hypothetical protein [Streptomyces]|uniref:Uncharacterized protein n=1 Tax=Streptomyces luteosporeus TaxID=173856 RepID=A0ABP6G614_9ACTN